MAPSDAAVRDVTDDPNPQVIDSPEVLPHRQDVGQGLSGVLAPAIACVDHREPGPASNEAGHTDLAVPHHQEIAAQRTQGERGVPQRLALLQGRGLGAEGHHVGAEMKGSLLEREPGACRRLEEGGGHRHPGKVRASLVPALDLLAEALGIVEQVLDDRPRAPAEGEQPAHATATRSIHTP